MSKTPAYCEIEPLNVWRGVDDSDKRKWEPSKFERKENCGNQSGRLEARPSGSKSVLTHKSLLWELPTLTCNMAYDVSAQGLQMLEAVSEGQNFRNEDSERFERGKVTFAGRSEC